MVVFELAMDLARWKRAATGGEMGFSIFIVQRVGRRVLLHGKVEANMSNRRGLEKKSVLYTTLIHKIPITCYEVL